MQLTEQEILEKEEDDVNFLTSMANVDAQTARRVLKKHNGDMAKAADALLAGDRAGDWEKKLRTTPEPMYSDGMNTSTPITINLPLPSASVIDLTADTEDDEMTRAIQMSMEESSQSQPQFGPSERAPHPEWQMVRSNDPVIPGSTTTEDHTLNEAIQASLQDFREDADITPLQLTIREGNRPIALRTDTRELAYAALVIQAIYFIPQARATVSNLRLNKIDHLGTPPGHPDRAMWNLIELFTNMDLAQIAVIVDNELLPSLYVEGLDSKKTLPDASTSVVKAVATVIEQHIAAQTPEGEELEHLFSFSHANVTLVNGIQTKAQRSSEDGMVVVVDFGHTPHNDLISCISDNLTRIGNRSSSHDVIIRPSDIISFQLKRASNSTSKSSPDPFVYQKTIYLDRFLFDNIQLTNSKRKQEREMLDEIHRLKVMKETLTRSDNRDSLKTLRATIHYFENVANPDGDSTRRASLERVAQHLKNIMTVIESKVEDIDHQIEKLQAAVAVVYDCPELQRYRYDLRSVLVHSGLPGRKQMYSYVQDNEGVWWKTVDLEVTEVPEETVLTDPTGLHLGAGPYLLFYSRHLSEEQKHEPIVWPTLFSEAVEENNKKFLAEMHPELEIFSNSKPSFEAPLARALPIPQELQNRTHSRENSRAMSVDKEPL